MTNSKFDVYVVILTQGTIVAEMTTKIFQYLSEYMDNDKYNIIFGTSQRIIVDNNRNNIVKKFLENEWDYLLMLDEDNPPEKNPLDLLALNLDIVVCPTPMIRKDLNPPITFSVFDKVENGYKGLSYQGGDKLQEIDAGGTGCMMIRRQVLEVIKAPFESDWNEDGTRGTGSDIKFCDKAKEKGFKVWAHWDYICSHYKRVNLLDILDMIKKT